MRMPSIDGNNLTHPPTAGVAPLLIRRRARRRKGGIIAKLGITTTYKDVEALAVGEILERSVKIALINPPGKIAE